MEAKPRVLIVDDEPGVRESLRMALKSKYDLVLVESGEEALSWLEANSCDLVLLDIMMGGIDGLEVLERIRPRHRNLSVVMLTATKTVKTAVLAMKLGAEGYITKPYDLDELRLACERATEKTAQNLEVEQLRKELDRKFSCENIIGPSEPMQELFRTVDAVAPLRTSVLLTGESGTGKEVFARAIHNRSPRKDKPMVALNCAAIPDDLLESELFGHEKGSFTDAVDKKIGQFELADGGTIFLDEIGEMSAALQAKLLRVLEEGEIARVGGAHPLRIDVRVIAATNVDLHDAIAEGRFRRDLYYRLNVVCLELPELRRRPEDIPHLIAHFLKSKSEEIGVPVRELAGETVDRMVTYHWPGNVRELENVVERLLVMSAASPSGPIPPQHLPADMNRPVERAALPVRDAVLNGQCSLSDAVAEFEREIISEALEQTYFNQTRAADLLGTTRRILKYRMDQLGIVSGAAPVRGKAAPEGHAGTSVQDFSSGHSYVGTTGETSSAPMFASSPRNNH